MVQRRPLRRLLSLAPLLALLALLPALAAPAPARAVSDRPVVAFYYPWWEQDDWQPPRSDQKSDLPAPRYGGGDDAAIRRHVQQADEAGIDVLVCAWFGPGDQRIDERCKKLIQFAREDGRDLQVAILPEQNLDFTGLKSVDGLAGALDVLEQSYFNEPNYFRYQGRPAVFFFRLEGFGGAGMWQQVRDRADPGRGQYWFGGSDQFGFLDAHDALFYYDISWESRSGAAMDSYARRLADYNRSRGQSRPFVATVMPGYDDRRIQPPRSDAHFKDRADGAYYRSTWQDATRRSPQVVVITSFNEFSEGHHIEPSERYGDLYLRLTRELSDAFRAGAGQPPQPPGECQTFPETGFQVCGRILQYWRENGGLPVFGFPIGPQQGVTIEGRVFQAQEFERNRLELHPENARPYDVLLGRLGAEILERQGRDWQQFPRVGAAPGGCLFFQETGHSLCEPFLSYFRGKGLEFDGRPGYSLAESVALFGLPLSEPQPEQIQGNSYTAQWFERARFEHHPENAGTPYEVLLGLLGVERR